MPIGPPILVIGGTGVVGRPVVRTLIARGHAVRVMARDVRRAGAAVPESVTVVPGDLRDVGSIRRALAGCRAVFTAVSNPLRRERPDFDPDREGTENLIRAARSLGSDPLVVRTSAMAVERATSDWWAAESKVHADEAVAASGLPHVILRPTWFTESLATTAVGPLLVRLPAPPDARLWWLAGEDYGRLVDAILTRPEPALGRMLDVQGAESLTMTEAVRAFVHPWRQFLRPVPMPAPALALAARLAEPPAYLRALLAYTFTHVCPVPRETPADELHRPAIGVAACAADLLARGELPSKRLG
jgi:uncharacterized protein YbjT (DUF2867 family)